LNENTTPPNQTYRSPILKQRVKVQNERFWLLLISLSLSLSRIGYLGLSQNDMHSYLMKTTRLWILVFLMMDRNLVICPTTNYNLSLSLLSPICFSNDNSPVML
jgi:hypothetical protein